MPEFPGFIGESYTARALAFDAQRSMNLYLEADESGTGKWPRALLGTPGMELLLTLPTAPFRGIWTGLVDNLPGSTGTDLSYAVAGSKLYELFNLSGVVNTSGLNVTWVSGANFTAAQAGQPISIAGVSYIVLTRNSSTSLTLTSSAGTQSGAVWNGWSFTALGDVGADAANSLCQFQVNGSQILISSAGLLWIWNNVTLAQVFFNDGTGTVDTSGTAVTLDAGSTFDASQIGSYILIAGTAYLISAFADESHITLSSTAGTQTGATFYVLTGATSTPVYVQAAQISYLDTYFIALPPGSKVYFISAINDGTNWNPLDFGVKAAFPDNISSILADHENLWLFGSEASEVDQDTGGSTTSTFPFQRNPGAIIAQGCRAPFTAVSVANGIAWIGGTTQGNPIAWFANGFVPRRISTHAIESAWGQYSTVTDAVAFAYVQDGHQFWVISFPTANATWVWDATAGSWHERGWWNGTSFDRHRLSTLGYAFGQYFGGDWQTGQLHALSLNLYSDGFTSSVESAVGYGKVDYIGLGSPPANWYQPSFNDSGWAAPVAGASINLPTITQAQFVTDTAGSRPDSTKSLFRFPFTLPPDFLDVQLTLAVDNFISAMYINGVAVTPPGTITGGGGFVFTAGTVLVPANLLVAGSNLFAIEVQNDVLGTGSPLGLSFRLDLESPTVRVRTAPHLSDQELRTFYHGVRLAMSSGPDPTLAWSDDIGAHYSTPKKGTLRRLSSSSAADAAQFVQWLRMGYSSNRIYSLTISDPVEIALTDAYIDASGGRPS